MGASNVITVVLDTLQDFLLREAGVADISNEHALAINAAWDQELIPTIVLNGEGIASVRTDECRIENDFVIDVQDDGFDTMKLEALNEAIIGIAKEAELDWPQVSTQGDCNVRKKRVTAIEGQVVEVDTSNRACRRFGFRHGQKIKSRYDGVCTVMGVAPVVSGATQDMNPAPEALWLAFESDEGRVVCAHPFEREEFALV